MFYNSYDNIGLIKILSFLKSHNTEYLSGQDLSDVLKISRVAVWKHIRTIKGLGYNIETKQKLGYKLVQNTQKLLPWEIVAGLKTKQIGKRAYYFDELDSTQNYASRLDKTENGAIVIAERQTDGRGRQQRRWESESGGIWLSIMLKPKLSSTAVTLVPITIAVALACAIEQTTNIKVEIKWPNDITIKSEKVSGIIIDASIESNRLEHIIIGIGINFEASKKLGKILEKTENFYGVTSIMEHDAEADRLKLVQRLCVELEKSLARLEGNQIKSIIKDWTAKSSTIGKKISATINQKKIVGVATKIDESGALMIKTSKGVLRVLADEVTHLR